MAIAEGLTALAASTIGVEVGPTCAGATELALIAAQTSSAERREPTIFSVHLCGEAALRRGCLSAVIVPHLPQGGPPSRVVLPAGLSAAGTPRSHFR